MSLAGRKADTRMVKTLGLACGRRTRVLEKKLSLAGAEGRRDGGGGVSLAGGRRTRVPERKLSLAGAEGRQFMPRRARP